MAQDGVMPQEDLLPILSITNGPGWSQLCEDLRGIDYGVEAPMSFRVTGLPSGVYLGIETLSKPNAQGMCKLTGVWLNSGSEDEGSRAIVLEYSPRERKGRVVSIS